MRSTAERRKAADDRQAADVLRVLWAIKAHLHGETPITPRLEPTS